MARLQKDKLIGLAKILAEAGGWQRIPDNEMLMEEHSYWGLRNQLGPATYFIFHIEKFYYSFLDIKTGDGEFDFYIGECVNVLHNILLEKYLGIDCKSKGWPCSFDGIKDNF